jgi:hypothetical protein
MALRRFEDLTTTEGDQTLTADGVVGYGLTLIDTSANAVVATLPPATGGRDVVTIVWSAGEHAASVAPDGTDRVTPEFDPGVAFNLSRGIGLVRIDTAAGVWS